MLIGMTNPPGGRDDEAAERGFQHGAEAGQRSDESGDGVEQTQEAEAWSRELRESDDAVDGGADTAHGPTPEQVRRAARLEERSYRHAQREKQKAAQAHDRAVDAHYRAAQLHDRQADLGWGNVEEHRELADEHREGAVADNVDTDRNRSAYDRSAYDGDGSEPPTPPAGPDV